MRIRICQKPCKFAFSDGSNRDFSRVPEMASAPTKAASPRGASASNPYWRIIPMRRTDAKSKGAQNAKQGGSERAAQGTPGDPVRHTARRGEGYFGRTERTVG